MTTAATDRTWTFPRRMLDDLIGLTLIVWAGYVVVIAGIIVGIATFGAISNSVWEQAIGLARWYVLFIGAYVAYDRLPLHITHGQTRRDFSIQTVIFVVLFTAASAVLTAIGFLLEIGLYRLNDWPRDLSNDHLFSSSGQLGLILTEYWLAHLVWTAVGAFLGAAFYRSDEAGFLAIVPALIPIAAADIALGASWGPVGFVLGRFFDPGAPPIAAAISIGVASFVLALAMAWPVVRDIPIRTKSS